MIKALLLIATILSINSNAFCQIKVAVAANAQFAMKELAHSDFVGYFISCKFNF